MATESKVEGTPTLLGTDEVVVKRADLLRVVIKAERIARDETTERLRARLERS